MVRYPRKSKGQTLWKFAFRRVSFNPLTSRCCFRISFFRLPFSFQNYGLANRPYGRDEPMLDPETFWRIPPDMNVPAIKAPERKIGPEAIAILNARRAGSRGKKKHSETTPISS